MTNSVHDMGGMDGFGPVKPERDEPVFHAKWEGRVLALSRAMGFAGAWRGDHTRDAQERLDPATYLSVLYYDRWALGMETNLIERGLATRAELDAGRALAPGKTMPRKLTMENLQTGLGRASFYRPEQAPAQFKAGDRVRTKNIHPRTHTRLPRYARDKLGIIERCHGCHSFPDAVAVDRGDDPQWLYTVAFTGGELWGPDAAPGLMVSIEAFEAYLERA